MKFAEHLLAHITPEWRRQYIVYEDMKTMLYEAVENLPAVESTEPLEIERLVRSFDENFLAFCEKELFKINVFYEEKLAEAKRKFDTLRKEMDTLALESQQQQQQRERGAGGGGKQSALLSPLGRLLGSSGLQAQQYQPTAADRLLAGPNSPRHFSHQPDLRLPILQLAAAAAAQQGHSPRSHGARGPTKGLARDAREPAGRRHSLAAATHRHQAAPAPARRKQVSVVGGVTAFASPQGGGGGGGGGGTAQQPASGPIGGAGPAAVGAAATATATGTQRTASSYPNYGTLFSTTSGIDRKKLNDLKLAFSEFYLSLVLLQNYQRLNFTGFRKIFKKHDKLLGNDEGKRWHHGRVESAFFHTNKDVDKLIEDTENIVTFQLESGDRQRAMKRLRVPPLNDTPQPWTAFRVGLALGALIVLTAAVVLTGVFQQTGDDWRIVFRLYRSSLFIIVFIFLVGVNIYGWRAHGVNHVLIFELDPRDHLSGQDLLEISFTFGVLWCLSVLVFLWSGPIGIPPLLNPMILNGVMIIYLLNPTKTLHYSARTWLICCIARIVSAPFHRVRFCDFWLADQLNSLVPVLLDIEYTSCFYLTSSDLYGNVAPDRCVVREPRDLLLRAMVACLPAWWRFAQCLRRYFDEGRRANPHLLNAGKYSTVWLVVIFSTLTEYNQDYYASSPENPFFICWICSLILGSCYTYTWDVRMDWGLVDSKAPPEYKFLREELVYPVRYYYMAIVGDLVLRFGWTLNLSLTEVKAIPPDLVTLVLAPCEIVRRFIWNFYRLENEHLNNCGEFRAVRDISISGQNIDLSALNRILRIMDEPDGLQAFRSRVKRQLMAAKKKAALVSEDASDPSVVLVI